MAMLRWMGVPEAEVRMVEGTYEKTTARVVVGEGASEEFVCNIGLRQGSVLSPLLFIAELDLISRKTVAKDAMKILLYADNLVLMTNGKQELQETMEEWDGLFTKHGLKLNLEKTEVLHIDHQREELDIEREGKILTQLDSFVYLGEAECGDGKTERGTSKSTGRSERMASSWRGDGGPADLKKTEGQGHEHLCHTSMPLRNGNLGTDRTTTTKSTSVRKQLGTKNSKSNEGRHANNGGVNGRDGRAEELDIDTGEEQINVGWTRRKDGGWQTTEETGRVTWAGQEETRENKVEMGRQDTDDGGND